MSSFLDALASNSNATEQSQSNPTVIFGGKVGNVDVSNTQSNETHQDADADFAHAFRGFAHGGDADASNSNGTLQSQANPTAILGQTIGNVDVSNTQSNETVQDADATGGFGGLKGVPHGFGGEADASNGNVTGQFQSNPTAILGGKVGNVDVSNTQTNETHQDADAASGFGGFKGVPHGFGGEAEASNGNATGQFQSNPTAIFGGEVGNVNVSNTQTNETHQDADATGGFGGLKCFPGFGDAGASNDNLTLQIQANPTVIVGDKIGNVDVSNTQTNETHQDADATGGPGHGLPHFDLAHGADLLHAFG